MLDIKPTTLASRMKALGLAPARARQRVLRGGYEADFLILKLAR